VNFKTYTKSLKFGKRIDAPKEEWRIFENTHPAIIEKGQWDRVQQLLKNKRRYTKIGKTSVFSGLLFCADCGAKLYFRADSKYKGGQDHFLCSNYKSGRGVCSVHYIREVPLKAMVLECIQDTLIYVRSFKEDFKLEFLQRDEKARKAELAQKRKTLFDAQKRLPELDTILNRIYEDNALGKLAEDRFLSYPMALKLSSGNLLPRVRSYIVRLKLMCRSPVMWIDSLL